MYSTEELINLTYNLIDTLSGRINTDLTASEKYKLYKSIEEVMINSLNNSLLNLLNSVESN